MCCYIETPPQKTPRASRAQSLNHSLGLKCLSRNSALCFQTKCSYTASSLARPVPICQDGTVPVAGPCASFPGSGMPGDDSTRWTTCLVLPHSLPSKIGSPQAASLHQGSGSKRKIPEGSGKREKVWACLLFPKNQASRKHRKLIGDVRYYKNIAHRNALKANLWQGFSSCIRQLVGKRIAPSSSWPGLPFVREVPLFLQTN